MRPSLPFRVIFVICHAGRPARYVWVIVRSVLKLFTLKPAETGVRPDVRLIIATEAYSAILIGGAYPHVNRGSTRSTAAP